MRTTISQKRIEYFAYIPPIDTASTDHLNKHNQLANCILCLSENRVVIQSIVVCGEDDRQQTAEDHYWCESNDNLGAASLLDISQ